MHAAKRLQFNLEVVPIEEIPYMSELREMYYPLFWVEEGAALNKTYVRPIKYTVRLIVRIQQFLKWSGLIFGTIGMIIAGMLLLLAEQSRG